ncbi:MAG: pantoate--beta-alanine ligase, partial [Flammeovirgaceae bacterium]|nr:pantoate--beta-alanine ligase [Flammeovirgaceae bacterium]
LVEAKELLRKGMLFSEIQNLMNQRIESHPDFKLEYFELADSENLISIRNVADSKNPILCIAGYAGEVRLIDNLLL